MPMLAHSSASVSSACFNGSSFCIEGMVEHAACQSPLATVYVPGFDGPIPTLDAQILNVDGTGPVLSFSGDAHNGKEITAAQLRAVVADVRNHLDRLLRVADQFEALAVNV